MSVSTHGTEFIVTRYHSPIVYLSVEQIAPDGTRTIQRTIALLERERQALIAALSDAGGELDYQRTVDII